METQKGFQETEAGIIPSDWDFDEIQNLSDITTGAKNTQDRVPDGDYPFFVRSQTIERINSYSFDGEAVLTAGDGVGTGKVFHYINGKFDFHQRVYKISNFSERLDGYFFYLYFNKNFYHRIMQMTAKSSVDSVRREMIAKMLIPVPPQTEQTTIAAVLNDADALITQLEKLITKKRNIKQGAMQELLTPKEGWGVERLGLIAVLKKGQLITEKTATLGNVPVIGGGMSTSYYHNEPNRKANTVTISASGANAGYVSFHVYPIFASDCTTIENSAEYDVRFLYFTLLSKQKEIFKLQTGGAQPHVYPEQLRDLEISIPKEKEEQTKVVQILIDMDAEIDALEKKLEKYKMIKQGMMQNLLTGMIRLL